MTAMDAHSPLSGEETAAFLSQRDTAVLSTVDQNGGASGAVVYYVMKGDYLYILTKDTTAKARNMLANPHIALTVFDPTRLQVAQLQATAEVETDKLMKEYVFSKLMKPRSTAKGDHMPPVASVHDGDFVVFRIAPTNFSFSDFSD